MRSEDFKGRIGRRQFIQGLGVSACLPWLDVEAANSRFGKIDVFLAAGKLGRTIMSIDDGKTYIKGEGEIEVNELNEFKLNKGEAHVVARKQLTLKTEFTSMKTEQSSFSAFARPNETEVHCKDGALEIVDALTRR